MTPLETYTEIGRLMFILAGRMSTPMEITARTDGTYDLAAPELHYNESFANRTACMEWLEDLVNGDMKHTEQKAREHRRTRLQEKQAQLDAETAALDAGPP